jgi:hypothetical protein
MERGRTGGSGYISDFRSALRGLSRVRVRAAEEAGITRSGQG